MVPLGARRPKPLRPCDTPPRPVRPKSSLSGRPPQHGRPEGWSCRSDRRRMRSDSILAGPRAAQRGDRPIRGPAGAFAGSALFPPSMGAGDTRHVTSLFRVSRAPSSPGSCPADPPKWTRWPRCSRRRRAARPEGLADLALAVRPARSAPLAALGRPRLLRAPVPARRPKATALHRRPLPPEGEGDRVPGPTPRPKAVCRCCPEAGESLPDSRCPWATSVSRRTCLSRS